MDFKLIGVEISSFFYVFFYFTAICGEKTMKYEVAVVCRGRIYAPSTPPQLRTSQFFSTYCRNIDKKTLKNDEISTPISLKSMNYIVSYSLLNLMMAPEQAETCRSFNIIYHRSTCCVLTSLHCTFLGNIIVLYKLIILEINYYKLKKKFILIVNTTASVLQNIT